jgi:hypothetical protein
MEVDATLTPFCPRQTSNAHGNNRFQGQAFRLRIVDIQKWDDYTRAKRVVNRFSSGCTAYRQKVVGRNYHERV